MSQLIRGEPVEPIATLTVKRVVETLKMVTKYRPGLYSLRYGSAYDERYTTTEVVLDVTLKTSSGKAFDLQVPAASAARFPIGATFDLIARQ
jgi:hypothetical protein